MSEYSILHNEIKQCKICEPHLDLGANPVLSFTPSSKLLIVGQAPGVRVHKTNIPWNDPSGDTLRKWLGVSKDVFYDATKIAIVPMGFCYPGKGKSGDLPPRKECAPKWHEKILALLSNLELILLIGQYAQSYYLNNGYKTLTENVKHYEKFGTKNFPLPHPSPRNRIWLKKNPWFEIELLPVLKNRVHSIL